MQAKNTEWMVAAASRFAAASPSNPFLRAVADSIEVGIVVPSILKAKLEAAGFSVIFDIADHAKHGFRELKNKARVAIVGLAKWHPEWPLAGDEGERRTQVAGAAHGKLIPAEPIDPDAILCPIQGWVKQVPDEQGAILHAVNGYLRECQHAEDRKAGLPKRVFGLGSPADLGIKG